MLRCLSLNQPWASLVAIGAKTIETRSWSTKHRGRIGIASTVKIDYGPIGMWTIGKWKGSAPYLFDEAKSVKHPLPLGALVATANLVDCVPIVEVALEAPAGCVLMCNGTLRHYPADVRSNFYVDITDQLPYGDFTPGRWAWLLDDVKATTERCPACWGEGGSWDAGSAYPCPGCDGKGVCEPVPVKGHQGLWTLHLT